jgi:hypothetical protein
MTVRELIEKLKEWPQDAEVQVEAPSPWGLSDSREIKSLEYWAAYNTAYVVID